MAIYNDLAQWALAALQADANVTALVVNGAVGVVESGEIDPKVLEDAQRTRRSEGWTTRVLTVFVMDTGERGSPGNRTTSCSVYVCDRAGYGRIRLVREAVLTALLDLPISLVRDAHIVKVHYAKRSGHQKFDEYNLDFERIDFEGPLGFYDSGDTYS